MQILIAACGERAVYGTVGTPERFFHAWKEPYPQTVKQLSRKLGRSPTPQDILLFGLLEPRNLLDLMRNFVVFDSEGGRKVRKLTRYRQFIAVNEAMRRIRSARKPSTRGGSVWHTQGSGKSLTMLWLALKLRRDESQRQPTVVIVTDRTKLDRQIAGVFETRGFPNPKRADSVRDLRRILTHPIGKTVMTTIQKFQEVGGRNDLNACVKVLEPEDVRAAFDLAFRRFSNSVWMPPSSSRFLPPCTRSCGANRPGRRTSGSTRGDSRSTGFSNASGRCRCARMPPPTT